MKRFFTKSVVLLFLSILLFGFFHFNTAFAVVSNATGNLLQTNRETTTPENSSTVAGNALIRQLNLVNEKLNLQNSITNSGLLATPEQQNRIAYLTEQINAINTNLQGAAKEQNSRTEFFEGLANTASKIANAFGEGIAATVGAVIIYTIELIVLPIVSFFLAVSGKILNFSILYTIYDGFKTFQPIIREVWVITRDMFNVTFIFVLLYVAITKIIGYTSVNTKKMLISIIVSALLINFSLFISKVVIDAGNMIASALLTQIEKEANPAKTIFGNLDATLNTTDKIQLSQRIMSGLGLQTTLDTGSLPSVSTDQAIKSAIKLILFLVTTFMFLFMALLLIGRFVMLIFLMATSPIGFIGGVIPKLGKASSSWWESLIDQTLVAPVFMFFMLLIIKITRHLPVSTGTNMTSYFNYAFILFLVFKAISITKSFSGKVGGFADQIATAGAGVALGAATGGASLAFTQTVGRGAAAIANSDALKAAAAKGGVGGIASRLALKASVGTAKSSFDIRNAPGAQKTLGLIKSEGGIDIGGSYGKGPSEKEAGFIAAKEAYAKKQADFAKNLTRDDDATKKEAEEAVSKKQEGEQGERDAERNKTQKEVREIEEKVNEMKSNVGNNEPAKLKQFEEELKKKKEEQKEQEKEFEKKEKKTEKEKKEEFEKLVKEEQKNLSTEYQRKYAETEEKAILAGESTLVNLLVKPFVKSTSYNKAGAAAVRKQAKGKSTADEAKDLLKKMEKESGEVKEEKKEEKPAEEEKPKS